MIPFAERVTRAPTRRLPRLLRSIRKQSRATPECPAEPRLDGQTAIVTGGNAGLGLFVSEGLAERGARVLIAARNVEQCAEACAALREIAPLEHGFVALDLADLDSVVAASEALAQQLQGRPAELLIANAGVWPRSFSRSAQGHELAFATNVLGHHLLIRRALERGQLRPDGRCVIVTGDIYFTTRECSAQFEYSGRGGGKQAYCRSKLGNLWMVAELTRRYPELRTCAAHPGAVATNLGGAGGRVGDAFKRALLISPEQGAQTLLWCATQPEVVAGGYYHNTMGRVELDASDSARDQAAAEAMSAWLEREIAERR